MATTQLPLVGGYPRGPASTCRNDAWYAGPVATVCFISAAIVYMTWAAFQASHYYAAPYLSPLYSPVLFTNAAAQGAAPTWHAWLGTWPSWWPSAIPASPALLILAFPGAFRFTCYYYRKAYYRSFAGSPPGCWVNPVGSGDYRGETALLTFQNLHRYAMYFGVLFLFVLFYDAAVSYWRNGQFGVGVGSLVLTVNFALLASYTLGCHSFRHIVGGSSDAMTGGRSTARFVRFRIATWFNERHKLAAWVSLGWVSLTDLYVRLVSMDVITDFNTWD